MAGVLSEIVTYKKAEVAAAKRTLPLSEVERHACAAPPVRGFLAALRRKEAAGQTALIAEIKKASPSKGLIRLDFDPESLARSYERGGAACLSVLTDGPSFHGSPAALIAAREASSLPVLRKDFMVDTWQIAESRATGADCILIIMACTSDTLAVELLAAATAFGMDTLPEVHNAVELERALSLNTTMIGINNRDLATFEVRLETTERLAVSVPASKFLVAESGIFAPRDIERLRQAGAKGFLVGESLMREADVEKATRSLLTTDANAELNACVPV